MITLRRQLLAGLLTFTVMVMPVAVVAADGQHDHDRGGNGHRLIDRETLKARIEALRDKSKEHRGEDHGDSDGSVAALQAQVTDLQNKVAALTSANTLTLNALQSAQSQISALLARVTTLESNPSGGGGSGLAALAKYVTVDPNPISGMNGPHVIFTGVNVHIRSGSGNTADGGTPTGLGNLIVGYNALPVQGGGQRIGSHNIVGGDGNSFTSFGGIVLGSQNTIGGAYTAILGGEMNQAVGFASSILGGRANSAVTSDQTIP